MSKPVRTTLIFGLVGGLLLYPLGCLFAGFAAWPAAFKLALWAMLGLYALLLGRWSRTRVPSVLFPLGLLLGAALWPWSGGGFYMMGLGILSWIRSGICFKGPALRLLAAEIVSAAGGAALVAAWEPGSALSWALAVWLFFVAQALYFYVLPDNAMPGGGVGGDSFETAFTEAEEILADGEGQTPY